MAMTGNEMGDLIYDEIKNILIVRFVGIFDHDLMRNICRAIGRGVVSHIQNKAVVNGGICKDGGAIKGASVE